MPSLWKLRITSLTECFNNMISSIRQKIIDTIIEQSRDIRNVYRVKSTFAGYPAAVVLPSPSDSDYNSTSDDRYTFAFRVDLYYPIGEEGEQETAEIALEAAIDDLISVFGKRSSLAPAADIVQPVPVTWGEEAIGNGTYRRASITLRAIVFASNQ